MTQQPPSAIGILGGTFDPVHFGHLRIALEMQQILRLQHIRLIPCKSPVHKNGVYVNGIHRLAMLELATINSPQLIVDDREIKRESKSYMIDTLISLREENPHTPLYLILGSDIFLGLTTWHRWQQLFDYAHIVVAMRPNTEFSPLTELQRVLDQRTVQDAEDLQQQLAGKIFLQAVTALDISSTTIRSQIKAGYDPSFLLPQNVWNYIQQHNLYLS